MLVVRCVSNRALWKPGSQDWDTLKEELTALDCAVTSGLSLRFLLGFGTSSLNSWRVLVSVKHLLMVK